MDFYNRISQHILETNYKTVDDLAVYLKAQFAIRNLMHPDEYMQVRDVYKEAINKRDNLKLMLDKMTKDKRLGKVIDKAKYAKTEDDLKKQNIMMSDINKKLSTYKQQLRKDTLIINNTKNQLFIHKLKDSISSLVGPEAQRQLFLDCAVTEQELSSSIKIGDEKGYTPTYTQSDSGQEQ